MLKKEYLRDLLPEDWKSKLTREFELEHMRDLVEFLNSRIEGGNNVFPPKEEIFSAFSFTPLNKVKIVILGQDPYHGEGQAHGLSFSVRKGIKVPPSLRNMYKEICIEYDLDMPEHGYLESWANQGVLMLNAVLTVEKAKAGSHQKKGWEQFTDKVIEVLNSDCENLVFLLWGSHAQKKGKSIDKEKHLVLEGPHPSPLSAYRGFFGCDHFKKANQYLVKHNQTEIDWRIQ